MKKRLPSRNKTRTASDKIYSVCSAEIAHALPAKVTRKTQARTILRLHDDGWTPGEIASRMSISEAAVRRTIAASILKVA